MSSTSKCGSGNTPLSKPAAIFILELLLDKRSIRGEVKETEIRVKGPSEENLKSDSSRKKRVCVFDLETRRSADEVGGWQNSHLMRMSVGVVYDSLEERCLTYFEKDIESLVEKLESADLVIGFNIINFDYKVLAPYTHKDLKKIITFDILADIRARLGHRLSLEHLTRNTLNSKKSGDGLQALKWFKEGRMDLIAGYCARDVEITRDLFLFGVSKGYVLFEKRGAGKARVKVDWNIETICRNSRP